MEIVFHVYLFIAGAVLGSFYNVVGLRTIKGESIVRPGSYCPGCGHSLTWKELFPVFSYIVQKGKCRRCRNHISVKYPLFELTTALLFTLSPLMVGWSKELLVALVFISLLVIVSVSDLEAKIIPDKILLFFLVPIAILRILEPLAPWWDSLAGAAFGFILFLLLAVVSKGGMGGGDIKFIGVIGLVIGFQGVLLTIFVSSLIGALGGLAAMSLQKAERKSQVPFGPFLAFGAIVSYFYQDTIVNWYLNVFLQGGVLWALF